MKAQWWWTSVRNPSVTIRYKDDDGIELLHNLLTENERVLLAVTDDEQGPWPVLEGTLSRLIELLRNQRFFEYILVHPTYEWIIFDTHENTLIIVGSLAERAADVLARRVNP